MSHATLPAIQSPDHGTGHRSAEAQERARARLQKLEGMYDYPGVLEPRIALKRRVLQESALGHHVPHGQKLHPADIETAEWMRQERIRADERAEKRWRKKFEELQQQLSRPATALRSPSGRDRSPSGRPQPPESQQWQALPTQGYPPTQSRSCSPKPGKAKAAEPTPTTLPNPQRSVSSGALPHRPSVASTPLAKGKSNKAELDSLRQELANVQMFLQEAYAERDVWKAKAEDRGERLKEALEGRRSAILQLKNCLQHLSSLGLGASEPNGLQPEFLTKEDTEAFHRKEGTTATEAEAYPPPERRPSGEGQDADVEPDKVEATNSIPGEFDIGEEDDEEAELARVKSQKALEVLFLLEDEEGPGDDLENWTPSPLAEGEHGAGGEEELKRRRSRSPSVIIKILEASPDGTVTEKDPVQLQTNSASCHVAEEG